MSKESGNKPVETTFTKEDLEAAFLSGMEQGEAHTSFSGKGYVRAKDRKSYMEMLADRYVNRILESKRNRFKQL